MRTKMNTWLILLTVLPGILFFIACSKKDNRPPAAVEQPSGDDASAAVEKSRTEAEERELRAEKIKFMYEDVYFKKIEQVQQEGQQQYPHEIVAVIDVFVLVSESSFF